MALPSLAALPVSVSMLWRAYQAPLLALAVSSAVVLAGRVRARPWAACAAAAGMLLGWGWRLDRPFTLRALDRAVSASAGTAQHLLLIAAVALGAGLLAGQARRRWLTLAAAILVGWWMARSPLSGAQFWRAWLAGAAIVVALLGANGQGSGARRLATVPFALAAGLLVVRAPAPWLDVALVGAAAALPLIVLTVEDATSLPLAMLGAAMAMAASLGAGRIARGGFGPVDLTCLLALASPWLVAPAAQRLDRGAPAAPIVVAAIAGALAWIGQFMLVHR